MRGHVVDGALRSLRRTATAVGHVARTAWRTLGWLWWEDECEPAAYALTPRNRRQLAAWLATLADTRIEQVQALVEELEDDKALRDHLRAGPRDEVGVARADPEYGRWAAAYVLTRLRRPRVVVESGVGAGLGACVVASALERNTAEGHPGFYYGLDPRLGAGRLLRGRFERYGWILAGSPIESLKELDSVDLYLYSRPRSETQEGREYETLAGRLAEDAMLLGATAHQSDALFDFAVQSGRRYLYFAEEPADHWYRGSGLGAAFT